MPILPNWSPKNPLEVIAQFLLLIYGICALLLGFSVTKLTSANQTTMVSFVVGFPIAVLLVFAWLVRNHHQKLYAPGDYRSDDAFFGNPGNPAALGAKLGDDDATEIVLDGDIQNIEPDADAAVPVEQAAPDPAPEASTSQRSAFLAETLAFQELQTEFGASIRRNVRLRSVTGGYRTVDGIIEASDGYSIVEIVSVNSRTNISRRIRNALESLTSVANNNDRFVNKIAVIVVSDQAYSVDVSKFIIRSGSGQVGVEFRVFALPVLLEKYGFSR